MMGRLFEVEKQIFLPASAAKALTEHLIPIDKIIFSQVTFCFMHMLARKNPLRFSYNWSMTSVKTEQCYKKA